MSLAEIFKALVWDQLVKAALGRLFLAVPLLGWGPIGFVLTWLATHFADKLFVELRTTASIELIELTNDAHKKEFHIAALRLKVIAVTKGTDSPEFKLEREKAKNALSKFVNFDVARK